MSLISTINFLPTPFKSLTNERFLGATMDQLYADPQTIPVSGYIGRRFAPTYKLGDNYIPEKSALRQNYQLEPSVVVKDANANVIFNSNYLDFLNGISTNNGLNNNHQRLTQSEAYNYDGHFDYDKFVNYYNYYWLGDGPAAVNVYANQVPLQNNFTVTRNTNINGYVFSGFGTHPNLDLTLARGGTYTFEVNQPGQQFWIQSLPGVTGVDPAIPSRNTRNIFGVTNNGMDVGTIKFKVPLGDAQQFYESMKTATKVDAAVTFGYKDIQNKLLSDFLAEFPDGLDGITNNLQNRTIIFNNSQIDDAQWTYAGLPNIPTIIPTSARLSAWAVSLTDGTNANSRIIVTPGASIPVKEKVFVLSGKTYASTQYWVNTNNTFNLVPDITSRLEYLYYQDSSNPNFFGRIKLVDNQTSTIDVNADIIGKTGYVNSNTNNNVIFTNGLKIQFDSSVTPATYANRQYYVDGVGTSITLTAVDQLVVPESFGANLATTPDYITINRGSQDLNPWARSNRWFHVDVINVTAQYNNSTADYGLNLPARRPIIEFEPNLQLVNHGKQAKPNIDLIIGVNPGESVSDAFAAIEGQVTATVDGVTLKPGMRVVFANDYDTNIINEAWEVTFPLINNITYINLIKTVDDPVYIGQHMLVTNGSHKGRVYYYTGTSWKLSQAKTGINQAPLFDLVDQSGYSFTNTTVYPGTSFTGTKFFGYPDDANGAKDTVLGFPLTYQNFNNIGDIVFTNYYDAGSTTTPANFTYTLARKTTTVNFNSGYLFKMNGLTNGTTFNAWTTTTEPTEQFQLITKFFDGSFIDVNGVLSPFVQIDILPTEQTTVPHLKVYVNNTLLMPDTDYTIVMVGMYYAIAINGALTVGDKIDAEIYSDTVSNLAYYKIPENLDYNPLNENFPTITLGQLRNHYNMLIENTSISSTGIIPVQDNNLKAQGGTLYQHSSPLIYAMAFLNDPNLNFVNSLNLAKREYTKFKNKFLSLCSTLTTIDYKNPQTGVDTILQNINAIKNSSFPWYYSDMVPQGSNYTTVTYLVLNVRQTNYEIGSIFDNTQLSNRAVLIWVNGVQQRLGTDYTFSNVSPAVIFSRSFVVGDSIVIRDYFNTDGNYIPETPSKLGLYPKFAPELYLDTTYQTPINVIRGHDGSITPAFNDFRDNYLLELERRIYNNIKVDHNKNKLNLYDIIPGRFRNNDYTLAEYNSIIGQAFLNWAGVNSVNYTDNTSYDPNNSWTWNYTLLPDIIDGTPINGSWRAIYKYWFDTDNPNNTPWEMLGLQEKPIWWETKYGPAPYTGGNTVLWQDLANGYNWNNGKPFTDVRFARPGLVNFIPVDSAGNLLSPSEIPLTKVYDTSYTSASFTVGDQGPAETAWRRSSDYVFSMQLVAALTKPAEYFSTNIDISRFFTNPLTKQFSTVNNQKINPMLLVVNGDTTSGVTQRASGYLNWITDYIKNVGIDPVTKINSYFQYMSIQLNYKVGGFTDQKLITVSAEQTTPASTNASVIIPDSNYKTYLKKSVPVGRAVYSAVVVEKTISGYTVTGYNTTNPFFTVIPSIADNKTTPITIGNLTVQIYQNSTNTPMMVPYGTEYTSAQQVADFLISYERFLLSQGFVFNKFNQDLKQPQDWRLSVQEFIYWSQQGWSTSSIIILNPVTVSLTLNTTGTVVDEVNNQSNMGKVLDQNFLPIKSNNFDIVRIENATAGNNFRISTLDGSIICFAELYLVQFEHTLIFDNVSDFGDILYVPSQGTRQYRLKLSGTKTGAWSGALSAPGFVYNDPNIDLWMPGTDYKTGDIVTYNTFYYTATKNIPASPTFDIIAWTQIDKASIKTGLLPSFGFNANEFNNFYDVDKPPINEKLQTYSGGLIGFRQRQYLDDLGISIPTQTKFYQGFIKAKGSKNSITALTSANFNNVSGNISIYEEWAFRVGTYGGVKTEIFKEFVLDQSIFTTSPVAVTSGNIFHSGNVIVTLNGNAMSKDNNGNITSNVYNASNLITTSTTLYNNRVTGQYEFDLPTTGYVNILDTDYQIFNINNFTSNVATVGIGNKVWVAKDYTGNWNIYRVNETNITATRATYGLDSYVAISFDRPHSFVIGDSFVLKYFGNNLDGVYEIVAAPSPVEVIISVTNSDALKLLIRSVSIIGNGTVYTLDPARGKHVDVINDLRPTNGWLENDRVWVDNALLPPAGSPLTEPLWAVYTYNSPWKSNSVTKLTANTSITNSYFGSNVKISQDKQHIYSTSPGTKQVKIFANVNGTYSGTNVVSLPVTGFGTVVESQGNILAISSTANVYIYNTDGTVLANTLTSANVVSISSLSMSKSVNGQQWLFVGDSKNNIVEAWAGNIDAGFTWKNNIYGRGSFGSTVKTNYFGNLLLISSPTSTGTVVNSGSVNVYSVFSANSAIVPHEHTPVLVSAKPNDSAGFGTSIDMDQTASNIYIGSPRSIISGFTNGLVERFTANIGGYYNIHANIIHPNSEVGNFGTSVSVSSDGKFLAIGSLDSASLETTTFDKGMLLIDSSTTVFIDYILNSGAVYLFEPLFDQTKTNDTGVYTFTQDLSTQLYAGDAYGTSIDISTGLIIVGAPGEFSSTGAAYLFKQNNYKQSWAIASYQQPTVDISSISRTFLYNNLNNNILAALDFIDPNKGKVLQIVDSDIDFKRVNDPAFYNQGTNTIYSDFAWGPAQVGKIWWDLNNVRYLNYEQDDLTYRLNHWGKMFPGSSIDIYEWVESANLPSEWPTANGTPLTPDNASYCTYGYIDTTGAVKFKYYFWVKNKTTVNTLAGKHNSALSIAAAIENPLSQGIPYATVLRDDTVALYNVNNLLSGKTTVLQIGSKYSDNANLVHSEYALVQEGNPQSKIPTAILNKLIDSLSGVDSKGNPVPDPSLPVSQRYGIGIRPRQTMIVNQKLAFANYLVLVNSYLLAYPVVERKVLTILNSEEAAPVAGSGAYDISVNTFEELSYIQTTDNNGVLLPQFVSAGYKALVLSDNTHTNLWTVYQWSGSAWVFQYAQKYKTNNYWSYADWYDSSYNSTSTPDVTVATQLDLGKLKLVAGQHIKVSNSGNGKFAIYYVNNALKLNLVGIQSGTVQISIGTIPNIELRQILLAMQENIFIDDLSAELNRIFFTTIKYILTEQKNVDWIFKTSFISATQNIRKLEELPAYVPDNQNFYSEYVNEVKPYRTIIREFIVDYQKDDPYSGDITDFDLPAYWDTVMQLYRSPSGEQPYDANLLSAGNSVYSQWNSKYTNGIVNVIVENPGTGYLFAPQVIISGTTGSGATATSVLDKNGGIAQVLITAPGTGYTTIPKIIFNGTGTGAVGRAVLRNVFDGNNTGHNLVRSISTTIKFDRVNYTNANTFVFWNTVTSANIGNIITANTIINLNNNLYKLNSDYAITGNLTLNTVNFPLTNVTPISARSFDNANDRIIAFNGNNTRLGGIANGIEYPGVVIDGSDYLNSNPIDSVFQSAYTDQVGINSGDLIVDGGAYYDTFSSHAPEELIPGRMFDALNMQVFDTNNLGFRIFDDLIGTVNYYRISGVATTTLRSNLNLLDTTIQVTNAELLPNPDRLHQLPGVVFINGERIVYWRNYALETPVAWTPNATIATSTVISYNGNTYITNGNVFAPYFANVVANIATINVNSLGQIRRATNGTSPGGIVNWSAYRTLDTFPIGTILSYNANSYITTGNVYGTSFTDVSVQANVQYYGSAFIHVKGSFVSDASVAQLIPKANVLNNFATTVSTDNTYTTADNASLRIQLTAPITANIGDQLTQQVSISSPIISYMRVLENVKNSKQVPVILLSGALEFTPDYFDGNIAGIVEFDTLPFDETAAALLFINNAQVATVNGITPYIYASNVIGEVNTSGQFTVPADTNLQTGKIWYNQGIGQATDGTGLINSITPQSLFIIGSKAYKP